MSIKQLLGGAALVGLLATLLVWVSSRPVAASTTGALMDQEAGVYESIVIRAVDEAGNQWQAQMPYTSDLTEEQMMVALFGESAPVDGRYQYELIYLPFIPAEVAAALDAAAAEERDAVAQQLMDDGLLPSPLKQSGTFAIANGGLLAADAGEAESVMQELEPLVAGDLQAVQDQVIVDDSIVQGSLCVGMDCVNGENFGFDTLRLKENNLRIKFQDTSNTGSFPTVDWQLTANDTTNGGSNYFAIESVDNGQQPFRVDYGAGSNALYIDSQGDVGINTSQPVLNLHIAEGNTPAIRLDQDGTGGWGYQIWDIAANEHSFFIRDATHSSQVPLQIRTNAPTGSIFVDTDGDIGFGTRSPQAVVHAYDSTTNAVGMRLQNGEGSWDVATDDTDLSFATNSTNAMTLDANGNLVLAGALLETSDVNQKENFAEVDVADVLDRVLSLNISTWNYIRDGESVQHMGPTAQDFFAAFTLGPDNRHIASLDVNGVALASIQALHGELEAAEAQIADLQSENESLEARLSELEALVNTLLETETGE